MRNRTSWTADLLPELIRALSEAPEPARTAARLCEVELGLYLMRRLTPDQPVGAGWVLFGGYPFAALAGYVPTDDAARILRIARMLLWPLRRPRSWMQAIDEYVDLDPVVRGYDIVGQNRPAEPRRPSIAAGRWAAYENALSSAPPYQTRDLPLATAGSWRFSEEKSWSSVILPPELPGGAARGHDLTEGPREGGKPLRVDLDELLATAQWIDNTLAAPGQPANDLWSQRLRRCELFVRGTEEFEKSKILTVDRMLHLIGMVGAGKSTLRDILAVWAARRGMRTTLVVGDVAEALRLVAFFTELGLRAAPVLGATTREQHLQRLHRRSAAIDGPLLNQDAPGFDYLSTACPLDALRGVEAAVPLRYSSSPCVQLYPAVRVPPRSLTVLAEEQTVPRPNGRQRHGCPLWQRCPRHHAARELVGADIWVATPAGLVHSAVPAHQNGERVRYLETACRRSDLIVVDEVDRVQQQLDSMFAPAAVLIGRSPNSWLDEIQQHKIARLAEQGRLQLSDDTVMRWTTALHTVAAAADRIYHMLLRNRDLRNWVEADYFNPWTLQYKLLDEWFGEQYEADAADTPQADRPAWDDEIGQSLGDEENGAEPQPESSDARTNLTSVLDKFRDDPLGEREHADERVDALVRLTRRLLHTTRTRDSRSLVEPALVQLLTSAGRDADLTTQRMSEQALRFEFTLILSALHTRLDLLTDLWPAVEAALDFPASSNVLARRPPDDYRPLVPESPMGNILGFQFIPDSESKVDSRSGELRFFRCAGNGRELLLQLPELTLADGLPAPNVLLMSGTSWAGTSTRYHILSEVGALLTPRSEELEAVGRSVFTTRFLQQDGRPLKLSGAKPHLRPVFLEQMLNQLAKRGADGTPSPFEQELAAIEDPRRRRLLVLTGSYDEARRAATILARIPRWEGNVCRLVPDDAEQDHRIAGPGEEVRSLARGDVAEFAATNTELLVAPLLAVERGHNILDGGVAAIGSAIFLARPHPRPDDIGLAIQAINDWASRRVRSPEFADQVEPAGDLDVVGRQFRTGARRRWRQLLSQPVVWRRLSPTERVSFTWDQLVVIWQVVGRLVRGGVPARVVFVDAPFAERAAEGSDLPDTRDSSLLVSMREVLDPYFDPDNASGVSPLDRHLVGTLYAPLHSALSQLFPR
ncbi:signal recognition particle [Kribbella solani]|uniref:pPIWI-RE three-gene island domain-containing protein n=1 Tax=Kribbella solani TaxID=236067 RepID=A0A841DSY8_9ACTN|nr:signal recognition particle [Kribbella solani]MBB5979840.1 hypothetical protein [Kribbella solani]